MKKMVFGPAGMFFLFAVSLATPVQAAELLDVKPIVTGSNVVIEVTADTPMTYTYYKVPGQAQAVVDIADADPEKVEPLIVVNKGAVASISVDKAVIGGMTVSRLVFNLVSVADISVNQAPDRKTLTIFFGDGKSVPALPATVSTAPAAAPAAVPAPQEPVAPAVAAVVAAPSKPVAKEEEDPLGLDEPKAAAAPVKVPAPAAVAVVAAPSKPVAKEEEDPLGLDEPQTAAAPVKVPVPAVAGSSKLEPVVPVATDQASPSMVIVKGIIIGASFIDIQTNGSVGKFKQTRLAKPERLSIEIPGTSTVSVKSIQVKRFGVSKVRIGTTPGFVRVVLDAAKSSFPKYEIISVENGLRVNFK